MSGGGGGEATESAFFFYFETWFLLLLQFFLVDTQTLARALLSRAFAFASVCLRVFVCCFVSDSLPAPQSQRLCVCVFLFLVFFPLFLTPFPRCGAIPLLKIQTARLQPVSLCFHSLPYLTVPCIIASSPSSSSLVVSLSL